MIVLGCDSRLLVFSLVTCCSCLSPKEETPFCLFPELNHFRILAGEAAIARGAGGAERLTRAEGTGAEQGLWEPPHWRRSLLELQPQMWARNAVRTLRSNIMDFSKTGEPPLDLHPPEFQRYLDIE